MLRPRPIFVKIYCATVEVSSITVPCGQYSDYNGTVDVCSGDHDSGATSNVGWTTIHSNPGRTKTRKLKNLEEAWIPQGPKKIKEQQGIHGIERLARLSQVLHGNEIAPVGFTRKAIPLRKKRRVESPNQ
jgi:hypothetical protein